MSNIVFILGAGASKQANAPLMGDFLDVAYDLWKLNLVKDADENFRAVFSGRSVLKQAHSNAQFDIKNIESVFAAFEMANMIGQFPGYSPRGIAELVASTKKVIQRTLEETIVFHLPSDETGRFYPPDPYRGFTDLVKYLKDDDAKPNQSVTIITFNYDLAIDFALNVAQLPFSYCLEETASDEIIPLLKLHGSLNWAQCSDKRCNKIIEMNFWDTPYFQKSYNFSSVEHNARMRVSRILPQFHHHEKVVNSDPFIVPPTWNKSQYNEFIAPVWKRAAKELSDADSIFVIGYSLPPTDMFFRDLYALGTVGDTILKRFWVFNPDKNVEKRFRAILGPGAEQSFRMFPSTFQEAIADIVREYGSNPLWLIS